jgi:transposase
MLNKQKTIRLSPYSDLYDILVKPDNRYRRFHDEVDFTFVREALAGRYSEFMGKTAVDPVVLIKCLIIKEITEFSDRDLMEEVRVNMAYKYFLDMLPEQEPFDASLLSYFRRKRLRGCDLLGTLLGQSLQLALEKGVLKRGNNGKVVVTVAVDSTHTESLGRVLLPREGIAHFCNKLSKAIRDSYGLGFDQWGQAPVFANTEEAVAYARALLSRALAEFPDCRVSGKTRLYYNRLEEALEDIADHGSCSASDRDARTGHKNAASHFEGYKSHIMTDVDSGLVLGAAVTSGEVSDTPVGEHLVDELVKSDDLELERLIGDGSYGSTAMMKKARHDSFDLVATANPMLGSSQSRYQQKGFTYNKDADMLVCPAGHMAVSSCVRHYKHEDNRTVRMFYFDVDRCRNCSNREGCYKAGAKSKSYSVTILTDLQKEYISKTKTPQFREHFRKRTAAERTNAELKRGRGLRKARYYGLEMMTVQAAVALFTYNLKKILFPKSRK